MSGVSKRETHTTSKVTDWNSDATEIPKETYEGTWIGYLFYKLDLRYNGRFLLRIQETSQSANIAKEWAEALNYAGITGVEVKHGLDNLPSRNEFSYKDGPTCPEFIALCRPIIDYQSAFTEAVNQLRLRAQGNDKWTCPAIYWAAIEVGEFDLRKSTWNQIKKQWTHVLNNRLMTDKYKPVPKATLALTHKISDEERVKNQKRFTGLIKDTLKKVV